VVGFQSDCIQMVNNFVTIPIFFNDFFEGRGEMCSNMEENYA